MFHKKPKLKRPIGLPEYEFEEYKSKEFLRMWRYPWGLWLMSSICFLSGCFLLASFTILEILDPTQIDLLQFLILSGFFFFSALFSVFAKIEVISFDKEEKMITWSKWVLCYNMKSSTFPIDELSDINLILKGREEKYSDTLYYKIMLIRKYNEPIEILETKNRKSAIDKALKIRAFFNIKGKIPLRDESEKKID